MQLSDQEEFINALYYGDGGTGKTTDLAAMANLGPIIYINAEAGLKARPLKKLGVKIENIRVWPEPGQAITFETLEDLHLELLDELVPTPGAPKAKTEKKNPVIGVAMDSVTEIYKKLLDREVARAVLKADNAGKERDPYRVELADYGIMTEQMRKLIRRFRDLPCHFAMAALSRREQDDDGAVTYQPAITPALQNDLIGWVDLVCVTSMDQVGEDEQYKGLFRAHSKYRGKDRLGALPKFLIDPTFDRIVGYVNDTLTTDKDPVQIKAKEAREALAAALEAAAA